MPAHHLIADLFSKTVNIAAFTKISGASCRRGLEQRANICRGLAEAEFERRMEAAESHDPLLRNHKAPLEPLQRIEAAKATAPSA